MAYVLLPPAGGVLLLITEHKSDYVRFVPCAEVLRIVMGLGADMEVRV
jgi:hypothetical protein